MLGGRQVARHGFGRDARVAHLVQRPAGDGAHFPPVEQQAAGAGGLAAQEDVFRDAQVRGQREVLVNGAHALGPGGQRGGGAVGLPVEDHFPGVGGIRPGEDAHQGRLARAVLADERVDAAGMDREIHTAQGRRGAKGLLDASHCEQRRGGRGRHGVERWAAELATNPYVDQKWRHPDPGKRSVHFGGGTFTLVFTVTGVSTVCATGRCSMASSTSLTPR